MHFHNINVGPVANSLNPWAFRSGFLYSFRCGFLLGFLGAALRPHAGNKTWARRCYHLSARLLHGSLRNLFLELPLLLLLLLLLCFCFCWWTTSSRQLTMSVAGVTLRHVFAQRLLALCCVLVWSLSCLCHVFVYLYTMCQLEIHSPLISSVLHLLHLYLYLLSSFWHRRQWAVHERWSNQQPSHRCSTSTNLFRRSPPPILSRSTLSGCKPLPYHSKCTTLSI